MSRSAAFLAAARFWTGCALGTRRKCALTSGEMELVAMFGGVSKKYVSKEDGNNVEDLAGSDVCWHLCHHGQSALAHKADSQRIFSRGVLV
jgi:hypothetical protein